METCFLALSFHNNKVFLTLDQCSLTLVNFILTLENLVPRVNDSWDSDLSENPVFLFSYDPEKDGSFSTACTLFQDRYRCRCG